jgi:hypothetical protein
MILDSLLSFVPVGANQSLVAGAGVSIASQNIIDLLGTGVGTAPQNIIGNATLFGEDAGVGMNKPQVEVLIGTAFTTGNSATLNVAFQGAPDTGSSGSYQPGTWTTLVETGAIAASSLTASAVIARFDFPPAFPANLSPRYLRLYFQIVSGTNFTAGTIASAIVTMVRDDQANKYATKNFFVA